MTHRRRSSRLPRPPYKLSIAACSRDAIETAQHRARSDSGPHGAFDATPLCSDAVAFCSASITCTQ